MKRVEAEVKCYKRKQKKKDSSGTQKEYKSYQSVINLNKDHPFQRGELVLVTAKDEYYKIVQEHEDQVQDLQSKIDQLENEKNFIETRLNKAYEELNEAQNEVKRLRDRGLVDYLKNALFKPKKAIEEGKN